MNPIKHKSKTRDSFNMEGLICMEYEEMVDIFQPLIINNLYIREVLPLLTFIEDHDGIYSLERFSQEKAVICLLKKIKASTEIGKWHKFIQALSDCGYDYIAKNIRGHGYVDLRYQGHYIQSLTPKLSKIIDPIKLLPHLQAEEVIDQKDREEIKTVYRNCDSIAAAVLLLSKIPKKHSKWYMKFIHVLRTVGYGKVAKDLDIPNLVEPCDAIDTRQCSSIYSSIAFEFEESVEIFKPLIVKNLIVREILPYLTFIDDHASIYAVERVSPRAAVMRVLEKLKISNEPGKWHKFIETLSACGYEYIVRNIKGYKCVFHDYQVDYVKSLTPKLSKVLQPFGLLPHLHAEDVISQADKQEIEMEYNNRGNIAASIMLLDRIPRKSSKWYIKFIFVLRRAKLHDIADDLDIPSLTGSEIGGAKVKTNTLNTMQLTCSAVSSSIMSNDHTYENIVKTQIVPPVIPRRMKRENYTNYTSENSTKSSTTQSKTSRERDVTPNQKTDNRESELLEQQTVCGDIEKQMQKVPPVPPKQMKRENYTNTFRNITESSTTRQQSSWEKEMKPNPKTDNRESELEQQTVCGDIEKQMQKVPPVPPKQMKRENYTNTFENRTESSTTRQQSSWEKEMKPSPKTDNRESELEQQTVYGDIDELSACLLSMPDKVLVTILRNVHLLELLQSVNRICKRLKIIIDCKSVLWENFEFNRQLQFNASALENILEHSMFFKRFIICRAEIYCPVPEIDLLLTQKLASEKLCWLDIAGMPVSTLCFLKQIPNLEILNVSNCFNLKDVDFTVISCCKRLDQLYVSFTEVNPKTVISICSELQLTTLDICGITITINECDCILRERFNTLQFLHLSLDNGEDRLLFEKRIKPKYSDVSFYDENSTAL